MQTELTMNVPDESEIDIEFIKMLIRQTKKSQHIKVIKIEAGMLVQTSNEAKQYLERLNKRLKDIKLIVQTDSLPTRLDATFIKRYCLNSIKLNVIKKSLSNAKIWLN